MRGARIRDRLVVGWLPEHEFHSVVVASRCRQLGRRQGEEDGSRCLVFQCSAMEHVLLVVAMFVGSLAAWHSIIVRGVPACMWK
ncbi:hypothetical protein LZ31DRAFT_234243 [Colletotrichum somersetense]|nr:hypothetical protein LZ31DRAFT_234243 [Colletotrichum somersetense]